ncbi:MAG: protein kinase domain-containing protein [Desulfobaccales bacterium]
MAYPVASDYCEELQNPKFCLKDGTLHNCAVTTNQLGLPRLITGNVAAVCRLQCGRKSWAIRCFCREVPDIKEHYRIIGDYLKNNRLPEFVDFEYQAEGIKVKGSRYPIIKMEWVEGDPLHVYVGNHLRKPKILAGLAEQCRQVVAAMRSHKMAHGDLQHGNIMVTQGGKIKLVDYDGMYVHKHKNKKSPERGHPNYQHPQRSGDNFNENLDNFSAILIYLSLLALAQEPRLWKEFHNEDNLILLDKDLTNPSQSRVFTRLKNNPNELVKYLAGCLEKFCQVPLAKVPDLESVLVSAPGVAAKPARPAATASPPSRRPKPPVDRWWETHTPTPPVRPSPSGSSPSSPSTATGSVGTGKISWWTQTETIKDPLVTPKSGTSSSKAQPSALLRNIQPNQAVKGLFAVTFAIVFLASFVINEILWKVLSLVGAWSYIMAMKDYSLYFFSKEEMNLRNLAIALTRLLAPSLLFIGFIYFVSTHVVQYLQQEAMKPKPRVHSTFVPPSSISLPPTQRISPSIPPTLPPVTIKPPQPSDIIQPHSVLPSPKTVKIAPRQKPKSEMQQAQKPPPPEPRPSSRPYTKKPGGPKQWE